MGALILISVYFIFHQYLLHDRVYLLLSGVGTFLFYFFFIFHVLIRINRPAIRSISIVRFKKNQSTVRSALRSALRWVTPNEYLSIFLRKGYQIHIWLAFQTIKIGDQKKQHFCHSFVCSFLVGFYLSSAEGEEGVVNFSGLKVFLFILKRKITISLAIQSIQKNKQSWIGPRHPKIWPKHFINWWG